MKGSGPPPSCEAAEDGHAPAERNPYAIRKPNPLLDLRQVCVLMLMGAGCDIVQNALVRLVLKGEYADSHHARSRVRGEKEA